MARMTAATRDLKTALAHTLPVLNRNPYYPVLNAAQFVVGPDSVHIVSTDRYIVVASDLKVTDVTETRRRRLNVALTRPQLLLLRAYLQHVAGKHVQLHVTENFITLNPDSDIPLPLRAAADDEHIPYPNLLPMVRAAFADTEISTVASAPKSYDPSLVSHIKGAEIWASGGDHRPSIFTNLAGTFGIIMPLARPVAEEASALRDTAPTLFVPEAGVETEEES